MKGFVPGLLLAALLLPVNVLAADRLTTEQRLETMERRVGKITDLTLRLDAVQQENRRLRGEIETLHHQIEQLKRKQRDIYLDIDQRLSNIGSSAPATPAAPVATPASVAPAGERDAADKAAVTQTTAPAAADPQQMQADYKAAYALLSPGQRRYADAAKAFTAFLEKYPGSSLAPNAQYWLAEAYYVSQKNDQALNAFRKVVNDHPTSPKVPGSLYKIGRLEHVRGDNKAAREALQKVVKEYPTAPAAGLAKELLAKIGR